MERLRIVKKEVPYGRSIDRSRDTRYTVQDNLMAFYFNYIYPHRGSIIKENPIEHIKKDNNRYLGHVYEDIVKGNIYKLKLPIERYKRWWTRGTRSSVRRNSGNSCRHKDKEIDIVAEGENRLFKFEVKLTEWIGYQKEPAEFE
ncbi:MAG: DUF234 domain-containing protein [Thermoplasmata archaeon]